MAPMLASKQNATPDSRATELAGTVSQNSRCLRVRSTNSRNELNCSSDVPGDPFILNLLDRPTGRLIFGAI